MLHTKFLSGCGFGVLVMAWLWGGVGGGRVGADGGWGGWSGDRYPSGWNDVFPVNKLSQDISGHVIGVVVSTFSVPAPKKLVISAIVIPTADWIPVDRYEKRSTHMSCAQVFMVTFQFFVNLISSVYLLQKLQVKVRVLSQKLTGFMLMSILLWFSSCWVLLLIIFRAIAKSVDDLLALSISNSPQVKIY